jgi:competence protein ComEC
MPALPSALIAFAAGAVLLQWQPVLPSLALCLGVATMATLLAIALAKAARGRPATRAAARLLLIAAAGSLGFAYAAWRADLRLADALAPEWEGQDVVLVGVISDIPKVSPRGARFAFDVEAVETSRASVPACISLSWYAQARKDGTDDAVPELIAGERWRLKVRLKRPHGTVNPHGFDVEAWLLENGLRATGYVRGDAVNVRVDAFAGRAGDYVERARTAVRDRIVGALGEAPYAGVIVALAIGEERAIPDAQWRVFNRTGITHLISISGLHVTVFAAIAGAVGFALARRSVRLTERIPARRVAAIVGVIAATLYALLAGSQVPAMRTLVMLDVAALGLWLARPGSALVVWLWALVAVLMWDPWAGFAPGFWLSFGAVGLLLYANAGRLRPPVASTRFGRMRGALHAATRTQALVTIGLVPGTLAIFQQVSIVSPLANALAIPVVTFLVVPLALAGIVLPFDVPWQGAHAVFATLMIALDALASAPAAVWQQHAPPAWTIATALVGVAWLAAPRGVPGRIVGMIGLLPLFVVTPPPPAPGTFRLTVLDVGQGLAIVVATHRHALLYDTGPRYHEEADAGGRIVAPYLRAAGVSRLDAMVVTHQDSDHSGGALSVLSAVPVERFLSSLPEDHAILAQRASDHGDARRCEAGQRWEWDGVRFVVLQPGPQHYANPRLKPNDLSCVVRVESEFGTALLTGDLEARGEQELVHADPDLLKADLLVVPHHGSMTSSTPAFIAAVAPEIAVYTPGYRNRFGHPRAEVAARYDAAGIRTFRTDLDGALTFSFAPGVPHTPRVERAIDRRYWRDAPEAARLPMPETPAQLDALRID